MFLMLSKFEILVMENMFSMPNEQINSVSLIHKATYHRGYLPSISTVEYMMVWKKNHT